MNIALSTYEKEKSFNAYDAMTSLVVNAHGCKIRKKDKKNARNVHIQQSSHILFYGMQYFMDEVLVSLNCASWLDISILLCLEQLNILADRLFFICILNICLFTFITITFLQTHIV